MSFGGSNTHHLPTRICYISHRASYMNTGKIAFSLCLDLCCQNGLGYMSSGEAVLNENLLQEFYIRSHTHLSSSEIECSHGKIIEIYNTVTVFNHRKTLMYRYMLMFECHCIGKVKHGNLGKHKQSSSPNFHAKIISEERHCKQQ